jgi:concanavalin A-like lectin/glucanase superfamily protein/IPT/TIG domain-containing protein
MKSFKNNIPFVLTLLALAAICNSCNKGPDIKTYDYPAPLPQGFSPNIGYAGTDIIITGSSFGDYRNAVKVFFNGIQADTIRSCEDGKIIVKVPAAAISGKVTLQVWTNTVDSIGSYTVIPSPVVKSVTPNVGFPGDTVIVNGSGFGTDIPKLNVSFNGPNGSIIDATDTLLTVIVPPGFTSGNLVVSVNNFPVTGPVFGALATVPDPAYQLDFEDNLNDKMGGTAATYTQGAAATLSYVTGVNGKAVSLAGWPNSATTNNQIIVLPSAIVKLQKEFSVTCWVNWLGKLNQEPVFDFGETRGNRVALMARMQSGFAGGTAGVNPVGRLIFENKTGFTGFNDLNAVTSKALPLNSWHHLAMTVSTANKLLSVYLDGVLIGSKTLPAAADPTLINYNKAYIAAPSYGVLNEPAFGGMIDKFQVFYSALSADQVFTNYYKK